MIKEATEAAGQLKKVFSGTVDIGNMSADTIGKYVEYLKMKLMFNAGLSLISTVLFFATVITIVVLVRRRVNKTEPKNGG